MPFLLVINNREHLSQPDLARLAVILYKFYVILCVQFTIRMYQEWARLVIQ